MANSFGVPFGYCTAENLFELTIPPRFDSIAFRAPVTAAYADLEPTSREGSTYKEQLNGGFIGKSLTGICLRKTGASLDG